MSFRTIVFNQIQVIGRIWEPCCGICAISYHLRASDIENIRAMGDGLLTRQGVQAWLASNAGDFQQVLDFHADIQDFDSPWQLEDSELVFLDCLYPETA